ncbi:MAG TPA: disulfide bond formation protein B [Accumulibacter sp.]|nr:disulfide bond formation protein B [Accumulibacter sp.]
MKPLLVRALFGCQALAAVALTVTAVVAGEWLRLQACPLCIFQRLVYLLIAFIALGGVVLPACYRLWSGLVGLLAVGGAATAGYQSWLQFMPDPSRECGFSEPTLLEQLVNWLGMLWPKLFMATGFCSSKEWEIFGLSMANWSEIGFLGFLAVSVWLLSCRSLPFENADK